MLPKLHKFLHYLHILCCYWTRLKICIETLLSSGLPLTLGRSIFQAKVKNSLDMILK